MVYLSLPLLCDNTKFNNAFEQFVTHHPDKLQISLYLESVYGAFPYSLWNGGVNSNNGINLLYQDLNTFINTTRVPIRLDCSNILLNQNDLYDRHQNVILDLMQEKGNIIDIANLSTYNYIEKYYKNFNYSLSNNANLLHPFNENIINGFLNNDKIILLTLDNIDNIDLKLIKHILKIELLVGNSCHCYSNDIQYDCKRKEQNNQIIFSSKSFYQNCPYKINNFYNNNSLIDELQKYSKLGIHHFKIAPPSLCQINQFNRYIIHNLVKPEYYDFCFSYLNEKGVNE